MKEALLCQEDNNKNRIYLRVFSDENDNKVSANIHLKLINEDKQRLIGNYYFGEKTLYLKRKNSKHLHRSTNSYGFNYTIITDPYLDIKWIVAEIDRVFYRFPKSLITDFGSFLQFKQQGFELQKFLKFNLIKNYKIDNPQPKINPNE